MKKKLLFLLVFALGLFTINKSAAQISFTAIDASYTQTFDAIFGIGDISLNDNDALFPGLYTFRTTDNTQPQLIKAYVITNNTGRHYNFGLDGDADRALGTIYSSASGIIQFGFRFVNNTGVTITSLEITYTGEQWRTGGSATTQITNTLAFDYLQAASITDLTSGTYTLFDDLSFNSPTLTPPATTLNGNLAANRTLLTATINVTIPPGEEIMIRWTDVDDTSYDHALGVDDMTVTPKGVNVGTKDINKAEITFYPNPAKNILNVNNSKFQASSVEVYDMTGHRIMTQPMNPKTTSLNVADLSEGLYIIRFKSRNETYTGKFIKK
ncbi:MAG: T9SS type A sorting domain-containing protein [Bacteroidales bacterium]|nr:T9SS type A sorting domain-containing protein [Bacteroidales bacterium]